MITISHCAEILSHHIVHLSLFFNVLCMLFKWMKTTQAAQFPTWKSNPNQLPVKSLKFLLFVREWIEVAFFPILGLIGPEEWFGCSSHPRGLKIPSSAPMLWDSDESGLSCRGGEAEALFLSLILIFWVGLCCPEKVYLFRASSSKNKVKCGG